jgi:hypothetical protein
MRKTQSGRYRHMYFRFKVLTSALHRKQGNWYVQFTNSRHTNALRSVNQPELDILQGNRLENHELKRRTSCGLDSIMLTLVRIPSGSLKRVSKCLPPSHPLHTNQPSPMQKACSSPRTTPRTRARSRRRWRFWLRRQQERRCANSTSRLPLGRKINIPL